MSTRRILPTRMSERENAHKTLTMLSLRDITQADSLMLRIVDDLMITVDRWRACKQMF